jgi:hypothetical protein
LSRIESQATQLITSTAISASGNLFPNSSVDGITGMVNTTGFNNIYLVLFSTGVGSWTVNPQGYFLDAAKTYFNLGYEPTSNQTTLTRAAGAYSLSSGTSIVLKILDQAPAMQFVGALTSTSTLTASLFLCPL